MSSPCFGQHGFSLSTSLEVPIDFRKDLHNKTIGFNGEYRKQTRWGTTEFGIGYLSFNSKVDTLFYQIYPWEVGKDTFSDYKIFQIYWGNSYVFDLNKDFLQFLIGVNFGYYYVKYEYTDYYYGESITEGRVTVVPKCSLVFNLGNDMGVFIESKFNAYFSLVSEPFDGYYFEDNVGILDYHLSAGLGFFKYF